MLHDVIYYNVLNELTVVPGQTIYASYIQYPLKNGYYMYGEAQACVKDGMVTAIVKGNPNAYVHPIV